MDSGERRKIDSSSGVQQRNTVGPALFCLPLRPGLMRLRAAFETEGVEAFAYMDDVSLGLMHVTASTLAAVPSLRRELNEIGITTNPTKTFALTPKGHVPTEEGIALLASVDVRITEEGGETVLGVPVGSDAHEAERAVGVVRNGGAERLASLLARIPDKLPPSRRKAGRRWWASRSDLARTRLSELSG